jgi:hypothetical protein
MSKRPKGNTAPAVKAPAPQTPTEPAAEPLKPRRGLFLALLAGFAAWIVVLLGLYFTTVYPLRHASTGAATRPGASDLPSAPR